MNAVIDQSAFDSIKNYIDYVKKSSSAEIITGGNYDDKKDISLNQQLSLHPIQISKLCVKKYLDQF